MSYTVHEVESAIESSDDFDGWDDVKWRSDGTVVFDVSLGGGKVSVTKVDDFGGEGQSDEYWVVVKVGERFFRKEGFYASNYGSDWDNDLEEVTPTEKTITVYEAV